MTKSTSDADLIRHADVRLCRISLWSNFEGFGFRLQSTSRPPSVVCLVESNGPATTGGLKIGDVILAVNDQDMSEAKCDVVIATIKTSKDNTTRVELLVVNQDIYKVLKKREICIISISPTIATTPDKMPDEFYTFSENTPRICRLYSGRKDVKFGFDVVDGDNNIGLYIQRVFDNSLASNAGLRNNDRIIEINGRNVDKNSSEYIEQKLNKAKNKGKLKLLVADTQTYECYMKLNIKFSSSKARDANYLIAQKTSDKSTTDQKHILNRFDDASRTTFDKSSRKNDTIKSVYSSFTSLSSEKVRSDSKQANDTCTGSTKRFYGSLGTLNEIDFDLKEKSKSTDFIDNKIVYADKSLDKNASYTDNNISSDYPVTSKYPDSDMKDVASRKFDSVPTRARQTTLIEKSTDKYNCYQTTTDISSSTRPTSRHHSLNNIRKSNQSLLLETSTKETNVNVCNGTILVRQGDLKTQLVDAIVVASTSDCLRENVLRHAGSSVKTAYETQKRIHPTKIISTDGGQLLCEKIYFIPCPQMSKNADKWTFRKFVGEAITAATNDSTATIQSIAFPAIGCGQYNYDFNFVAKTLIMAVTYELQQRSSLKLNVYFVIQQRQQNIFQAFQNELLRLKTNGSPYTTSRIIPIDVELPKPSEPHKNLLDHSSSDCTMAVNEFSTTMTQEKCKEILRVERVWNERWYKQYQIHRDEFSLRLKTDTEKYLFHGCSESAANNIIKGCFNRSYAGQHGTNYGKGVYFSSKASYSHSYATPNAAGERYMFLAQVLIGKTIIGNPSTKICPVGYDTTTNGSHIYVIYHDAQAFGQYLITYR